MEKEVNDQVKLHVVRVLNARELVISGGSAAGLEIDDLVRVLDEEIDLKDPVTDENLGSLRSTKALLRVYDVAPKYALARTFRTRKVKVGGGSAPAFSDIFAPPKYETRTETLQRDDTYDLQGESAVKAGDEVEVWEGSVSDAPSVTSWL